MLFPLTHNRLEVKVLEFDREDVLETEILSSYGELEDFRKSSIWRDIIGELDRWIEDIRSRMEDQTGTEHSWRILQGNIEGVRNCKRVLEILLDIKKMQDDNEEVLKDAK
jgi:hypothetical protein